MIMFVDVKHCLEATFRFISARAEKTVLLTTNCCIIIYTRLFAGELFEYSCCTDSYECDMPLLFVFVALLAASLYSQ